MGDAWRTIRLACDVGDAQVAAYLPAYGRLKTRQYTTATHPPSQVLEEGHGRRP